MIDFSEDIQEVSPNAAIDDPSSSLWVNRYRPKTLAEMCLNESTRKAFDAQIKAGDLQNVALIGPPGTGKTTLAMALCNEIKAEPLFVACAGGDGRVDSIAMKIIPFCQYSSGNNRKVVILDELDVDREGRVVDPHLSADNDHSAVLGRVQAPSEQRRAHHGRHQQCLAKQHAKTSF